MSEQIISFCDYCNSYQDLNPDDGRGLVECSEENAIELHDWAYKDEGIMCSECLDDLDEKEG